MQNKAERLYDASNQHFWQLEQANKTLNNKVIEKSTFEKSHKDLQERINDYIGLSEDYFWDLDEDYRYTFVSKKCVNITGFPVTSLIGSSFLDNLHEDDIKLFEEAIRKIVFRKKSIGLELRNLTHNNRWRIERVHIRPVFDKTGDCIGFRGVSRDLGKIIEEDEALDETPLINSAFSGRRLNERIPGTSYHEDQAESSDNYFDRVTEFISKYESTLDKVQAAFIQDQYDIICEYMDPLEKDAQLLGSEAIASAASELSRAASENQTADSIDSLIRTLEEHLTPVLENLRKTTQSMKSI